MINENSLSGEPDRVDNADTSAVPQEALEQLMPYQVSLLRALCAQRLAAQPAIAPYYQEPERPFISTPTGSSDWVPIGEQIASTQPPTEPLNLDSIFRAAYDMQHVFIRYEDMTPERQVAMHVMAEQIAQQSSRQLYERVMGNFDSAIPMAECELARRFDDSNTRLPLVPADELQPQEPITDLRLQMLAAREERINSLAKHANALKNNLMTSRKLEKQFPDPSKRFDEVHRFVKSLGLE